MVPVKNCNYWLFLLVLWVLAGVVSASDNTTALPAGTPGQAPSYGIRLFTPDSGSINSDQINDATNGRYGDVFFGTSFGLSHYNGTWNTLHVNRNDVSKGLLDDFITAVEYDSSGNLWIGYGGGIQIYDGRSFTTIRDQQLLKDRRISALQRQDDAMWVATGNAGIHRYRNGTWTWFQPFSQNGPEFYEVDSMALDPGSNTLVIATRKDGVWIVPSPPDPVRFERIDPGMQLPAPLLQVRQDPFGGVYLFDNRRIVHYSPSGGWIAVLAVPDFTPRQQLDINDIAAAPDGSISIGTDDGIYIWQDGAVLRHLGRFEGIGTSTVVRKLFVDARNRLWFATQGYVGYYLKKETPVTVVPVQVSNGTGKNPETPQITTEPSMVRTEISGAPVVTPTVVKEPSLLERLNNLLSDLFRSVRELVPGS